MVTPTNQLRDAAHKPDWARFTRLAGDHAAILFEDLRGRVSRIDGLREELFYHAPEGAERTDPGNRADWGWAPRYRIGQATLFSVFIRPGALEGVMTLESPLCERLLGSARIAARIKEAIQSAPSEAGVVTLRLPLRNVSDVRSFANLVILKSKAVAAR